jgi:putative two-component system response regulator
MSHKPLVVIADDDAQLRLILSQILLKQGYEVVALGEGNAAREVIAERMPDLVILDNYMPGASGNEICKEMKDDPKKRLIPVIMLTGYSETPDKIEAIEAGADDFINKPFNAMELVARVKALIKTKVLNDELDSAEGVIFSLARAIEAKDTYTQGHTERVSQLAVFVAHQLGLPAEEQEALFKGGILHDIGKIAIPDAVLNKPGRLTDEELLLVRTHPDRGEKICQPLNSMQKALQVIRHHHEKLDGSGYPDKLKGEQIPLVARIMAIVDVYDALSTSRSYKPAFPQDKTFAILEEEAAKGWWDSHVLREFKHIATLN